MGLGKLLSKFFLLCISLGIVGVLALTFAFVTAYPQLPPVNALTDYRPKLPLRIYSAENVLIGEFGKEHREFISINEVPEALKNAIIAAEDEHFWRHHGIDFVGIGRAALANVSARGARQGASARRPLPRPARARRGDGPPHEARVIFKTRRGVSDQRRVAFQSLVDERGVVAEVLRTARD